jgi:hypothetical protein
LVEAIMIFGLRGRSLFDFCGVAIVILGFENGDRSLIFDEVAIVILGVEIEIAV